MRDIGDVVASTPEVVVLAGESPELLLAFLAARDAARTPRGLWLRVDEDYPAALAARDVATLAWLTDLSDVVIESAHASAHAAVVEALLTNDEVNFANEVATLRGAYNRPAPPRAVRVWYESHGEIICADQRLIERGRRESVAGVLTDYA
jgi:hypothetical protein